MNLFFRFLWFIFKLRKINGSDLAQVSTRSFRVLPSDSDWFLHHLTNSRHQSFVDLARLDWFAQAGLYQTMRKHKIAHIIAASNVSYFGLLRLMSLFAVQSRALYCDHKYLYLQHTFLQNGKIRASAISKISFAKLSGKNIQIINFTDLCELAELAIPTQLQNQQELIVKYQELLAIKQ